jgi:uncharacterized protein YutE (UPF0331/DUF86 family)
MTSGSGWIPGRSSITSIPPRGDERIDLGTQLVTEQSARPPSDYADVFRILGEKGVIPGDLALRLGNAAKQRNLIVHLYMEIDDLAVFASLAYLDNLREFATAVERLADSTRGSASDPEA